MNYILNINDTKKEKQQQGKAPDKEKGLPFMPVSKQLSDWYEVNKRDLPWRRDRNPYHVWVSEIMLQQTRVEAVKPYYARFLKELPTIEALAGAREDRLLKLWEGLGYYSRVKNMQKAAIICCEQYNGRLPGTSEELLRLPGIGEYTAGAIASIAFKERVCAVDGNVLRVYARLFAVEEDILLPGTKKHIRQLMEQDMAEDMGVMNQALMDLGAGICLPKGTVHCERCPLVKCCRAYEEGSVSRLPVRSKKKPRKKEAYTVAVYVYEDQVLIGKRPDQGLLAGLYEFVMLEGHLAKKDFPKSQYLGRYKHIFSHIEWDMKGFMIQADKPFIKEGYKWVSRRELEEQYSIPGAFQPFKQKLSEK